MRKLLTRYADAILLTFLIVVGGGAGFGVGLMLLEFTGQKQRGEPLPAVGVYVGAIGAVCAYYVCMAAAKKIKTTSNEKGEEADYDESLPRRDES